MDCLGPRDGKNERLTIMFLVEVMKMRNAVKAVWVMAIVVLAAGSVQAAMVTWSSELLASDGSNILNDGVEHVGVSYGSGPDDSRIVNGVNFKANDTAWNHDNPNWAGWINDRNGAATRYGAAGDLKELTNDIVYGGSLMLRIRNLTVGETYRIQLISYDADNWWNSPEAAVERWQTITAAGGAAYMFQHGTDSPYAGINNVGAILVIGTWTADATEMEFTLDGNVGVEGNMNDNAIINGFVVQNIVPEPATLVLLGLGGVAMIRRRRS